MFICKKFFRKNAKIVKIEDTHTYFRTFPHKRAIYFSKHREQNPKH